jgi:hypothetical protein
MLILDNFTIDQTKKVIQKWEEPADHKRVKELNRLIADWVKSGVWDKLSAVWLHSAHAHQPSKINLIDPGTYTLTDINGVTFFPNSGVSTDGATTYYRTGWIPNVQPKWALNNAGIGLFMITTGGAAAAYATGATNVGLRPRTGSNVYSARVNTPTVVSSTVTTTNAKGLTVASRIDAASVSFYKDSVFQETIASVSTGVAGFEVYILCQNAGGVANTFIASPLKIGATIYCTGDINQAHLNAPLQTYMSNIGAI